MKQKVPVKLSDSVQSSPLLSYVYDENSMYERRLLDPPHSTCTRAACRCVLKLKWKIYRLQISSNDCIVRRCVRERTQGDMCTHDGETKCGKHIVKHKQRTWAHVAHGLLGGFVSIGQCDRIFYFLLHTHISNTHKICIIYEINLTLPGRVNAKHTSHSIHSVYGKIIVFCFIHSYIERFFLCFDRANAIQLKLLWIYTAFEITSTSERIDTNEKQSNHDKSTEKTMATTAYYECGDTKERINQLFTGEKWKKMN